MDTTPPAPHERSRHGVGAWYADFGYASGRVKVRKTGADLALDGTLVGEALVWFGYHLIVRLRSWWMAVTRRRRLSIWFTPDRPRPWYLVWSAMAWAGIRIAASPETADAAFYFDDATWGLVTAPLAARRLNFGCTDVSKSRVAAVFETVFGYPLAIDPQAWTGEAVEKGELNGAHDGRVIPCPAQPVAGRCYQRLVDTSDGAFTYDLRTHCIGGRPVAVWIKKKPLENRFSIHNLSVTLAAPEAVFSGDELERIGVFARAIGADWAGLDILRDQPSGRIYVVDVNKTDVGPIIALPLRDKLRSTAILAGALRGLIEAK